MELHKLIDALRVCADDDIICPACERYDEECDGSFNGTAQLMQCAADRLEAHKTAIDKLHMGYEKAKGAEKSLLREVLGLFGGGRVMAVRKPCSCGRGKPDVIKETRITRSGRKVTYHVCCPSCGRHTKRYKKEKDAIAEWNRRVEDGEAASLDREVRKPVLSGGDRTEGA